MKKHDLLDVEITDIRFPSVGIGQVDGREIWIKNTLPGQLVRARLTKMKTRLEAAVVEVLRCAAAEQSPDCALFGLCGGCTFRQIAYDEELRLKEKMVLEILREAEIGGFAYDGLVAAPFETGYRNKMEFSFGDDGLDGQLTLGLRKRGSYYETADISGCQICDADFRTVAAYTVDFFRAAGETFYHRTKHTGALRYLVVRKGFFTGEVLVNIVTASGLSADISAYAAGLRDLALDGSLVGVLHTTSDAVAEAVKPEKVDCLFGRDYYMEKLLGLSFRVSAFSFFQTNAAGAERLYATVREYAGQTDGRIVFDLYCGTGTIAQLVAAGAEKVVGIELVEDAVAAANDNAAANGLANCIFIAGDVLRKIDEVDDKPDVIILDPPREGMHPKALQKIEAFGAPVIVYVSCKPTSMARDLAELQKAGYTVERVRCHDMFPRTNHVETVVLLSKLKSTTSIEVKIDLDEMDLTQAESKATYDEIKAYVLDKYGFKVSQLYIAQVKRKHGIIERGNYNTGEGKAKVPQVPEDKEKAIEDALKHFQMI